MVVVTFDSNHTKLYLYDLLFCTLTRVPTTYHIYNISGGVFSIEMYRLFSLLIYYTFINLNISTEKILSYRYSMLSYLKYDFMFYILLYIHHDIWYSNSSRNA